MERNHCIDYVEFGARDLGAVKQFYSKVFGWSFTDYGSDYVAFRDGRMDGGFTTQVEPGTNPLVILYGSHLEATRASVLENGGSISKDIFAFPGGRRFHFRDPAGNELAVWSDAASNATG